MLLLLVEGHLGQECQKSDPLLQFFGLFHFPATSLLWDELVTICLFILNISALGYYFFVYLN